MSDYYNANSHFQQMLHAERVMVEYRRRLEALGYTFGTGTMYDCVMAPPGADPYEAARVWTVVNEELADD